MRRSGILIVSLIIILAAAAGAHSATERTGAVWVGSDGRGVISLFWLPTGGRWPQGGYRLERITRRKTVVLAARLRPGGEAAAMGALDPADAEAIRRFSEKVLAGSLTAEERRDSIAVMGRKAAAVPAYGRALGIRHADRDPKGPKRSYRLTALGAGGEAIESMESEVVDPGRGSPEPRRPINLRAEGNPEGVALFWADPPPRDGIPVVAYHIDRVGPGRRKQTLTPSPLLLDRHLRRGKPDYVHEKAPHEPAVYLVRSIDIFGRRSEPASVEVSLEDFYSVAGGPVAVQVSDWLAAQAGVADEAPADSARNAEVVKPAKSPTAAPKAAKVPAVTPPRTAASPPVDRGVSPAPRRAAAPSRSVPGENPPASSAPPATPKTYPGAVDFKATYIPSIAVRDEAQPTQAPSPAPPAPAPPPLKKGPPPPESFPPAEEFRAKYEPSEAISLPLESAPVPSAQSSPSGGKSGLPASPNADGPPGPPHITEIGSADGNVFVAFRPAPPEVRTTEVILLRSESPASSGVAVGRSWPAAAGRATDGGAYPGRAYWYRLVAVGADGSRSAPSQAKWIRVVPRAPDARREEAPERPPGLDSH